MLACLLDRHNILNIIHLSHAITDVRAIYLIDALSFVAVYLFLEGGGGGVVSQNNHHCLSCR